MKNNIIRTFSIVLIIFMLLFTFAVPVFADTTITLDTSGINTMNSQGDKTSLTTKFQSIMATALNVVKVIALAMALIMLAILAIKYMAAAPNDKAEIKKHAVVYIVGAVCLLGASGILQIIQTATNAFNDTGAGSGSGSTVS